MSERLLGRIHTIAWDALEERVVGDAPPDPVDFLDPRTGRATSYLTELGLYSLLCQLDIFDLASLVSPRVVSRACSRGVSEVTYDQGAMGPDALTSSLRDEFDLSFHRPSPEGDLSARWNMVYKKLSLCVGVAVISVEKHPINEQKRRLFYDNYVRTIPVPSRTEFDERVGVTREALTIRMLLDEFYDTDILPNWPS